MSRRQALVIVIAVAVLMVGIMLFRILGSNPLPPEEKPVNLSKVVRTQVVQNGPVAVSISVTGKLVAREKIEVYSEVTGKMLSGGKEFKEGVTYGSGEALVRIDAEESRLNLYAQRSTFQNQLTQLLPDLKIDFPQAFGRWEQFANAVDVEKALPKLPEVTDAKERNFLAGRNLFNQYYSIRSLEARLAKFSVGAPFNGVISQSMVNPGTLVRSGQKLGEFLNPASYELEAAINLTDAAYLSTGDTALLTSTEMPGTWTGVVKRVSRSLDPGTQTLKVFIAVSEEALKEGMYLKAEIASASIENALSLPRHYLSDEGSVYLVADTMLAAHPVEVVKYTETNVIVRGIPDGKLLLDERLNDPYEGMPVITTKRFREIEAKRAAEEEKKKSETEAAKDE